jgi:tetratricopeptide (TPR) repeat protein
LYARYFNPDAAPETRDEYLVEAFTLYEAGEYSRAIAAFGEITSAPLTRGETAEEALTIFNAFYYQALSYLATGNTAQAITAFKRLSTHNPFLQAKVRWYLALAYLKAGQWKEANQLLVQLSQNKEAKDYRQKARSLQQALRRKLEAV